jgi:hypothetical protein
MQAPYDCHKIAKIATVFKISSFSGLSFKNKNKEKTMPELSLQFASPYKQTPLN